MFACEGIEKGGEKIAVSVRSYHLPFPFFISKQVPLFMLSMQLNLWPSFLPPPPGRRVKVVCIVKKTATRTPTPHHTLYSKGKYTANVQGKASKKMQRFLWLSIIISSEFQLGIVETTLKCGMQLVICFLSLAREPICRLGVSNTSSRTHSTVQSAAQTGGV